MIQGKSISLCMVVWNNSELTEKAVASVKSVVDEIVIVDQGSTEEHSAKLKSLADIYFKVTNKGNADYDRQYCYGLATKDFILAMDSDEFITPENLAKLEMAMKYNFDIMWFMFDNKAVHGDREVNLDKMLGDDPHPRLWKRLIKMDGQEAPPIVWPQEAHQFPRLLSLRVIFCDLRFTHVRTLENIVRTHLKRGKNISPDAQQVEKNFVRAVFNEFGLETKKEFTQNIPELVEYLR